MPSLFWTGKLSLPMKLLVDANNLLALLTGASNDVGEMKERVKRGYEGQFSNHVHLYDEFGYDLQHRSARTQLEGLHFQGMRVLDVGCGTGALAQVAFESGAREVVCGDISAFMLNEARSKRDVPKHTYCQLDAEHLPYKDNSFDAVITGMTFGVLPNQEQAVAEMIRVAKPGGLVCVGAHGPQHYWEAIDASFRCITKRYILGYRLEWWPRTENYIRKLVERSGLKDVHSKQAIWWNEFETGAAAYDFFAAISASWWYAKFPPSEIVRESNKTRTYFEHNHINIITDDIVVAFGHKPVTVREQETGR